MPARADDPDVNPDDPLRTRVRDRWHLHLDEGQRSTVIAWASFTAAFAGVRALTHWIRDGHGPAGGGMSVGGRHFHHYNLGIGLLAVIGAIGMRGKDRHRHHPVTAASYGVANALIVDEAALLIDLKDVYWAKEGRTSVDLAIGVIGVGGLAAAGSSLWPALTRELRPARRRRR
jgi:hypothetical protein